MANKQKRQGFTIHVQETKDPHERIRVKRPREEPRRSHWHEYVEQGKPDLVDLFGRAAQ